MPLKKIKTGAQLCNPAEIGYSICSKLNYQLRLTLAKNGSNTFLEIT